MSTPPPLPGGKERKVEFERLSLPWEPFAEPKEADPFETPAHFIVQFLSFQFAKIAKEQLEIWLTKDDVTLSNEYPLELCTTPLAKLLQTMLKASKQCLSPLVSQFFAWRQTALSKPITQDQQRKKTEQLKGSGKKLSEKEVVALLEEKRNMFVDFLYSQSIYMFLSGSGSETPLASDISARIEESIFSYYAVEPPKYHDSASPANRQLNALYLSRVLGILSGFSSARMSAITKRFFLEIEQKDFFSKKMSIAEFLIPHLRSLKFDIQSEEGIKNVVGFLDPINKNFKEWTKKGRLRLAFSVMLGGVLQPLVTVTPIPGLNYSEWDASLKSLLAAATLAAKKKDKKSWQMLPLQVPLVSLQSSDLFYQNLEPLTEAILNNIKDTSLRQISLEALFCITLCYFTKYPDPNIQRLGKFLQALIASLYPKRKDFSIHKESVDIYVDILSLLSIYQRDTVMKNFIFEFTAMKDYGFNPETIIIGLLTFLNIANRTKRLPAIKTESLMMSIGSLDVSPGYDWRKESVRELVESRWAINKEDAPLNEDEMSKFNRCLQPIMVQVDGSVGAFLKNHPQKDTLLKDKDRLYVLDLLRVLIFSFRKTIPVGINTMDFLHFVSKLTIHVHEGICEEAWSLLVHLMNTRIKLRPAIITIYARLISNIQDIHVGIIRIALKNIIALLEQWIGELNRNPNATSETYSYEKVDVPEFEAGEIEALGLVLLCNTDSQTRAGGFELISLINTLCEKLGDIKTARIQTLIKEHRPAILSKSYHIRNNMQLNPNPQETREETIQAVSAKTEDADWPVRWSRLLGALATTVVSSCVETSTFAWKYVAPRIAALYPTLEASIKAGDPPEDKVALWRNYMCIGFAFSAVSDEGGDLVQGATFTINNFRDLFRSILPFLNNDVKVFREPAETAVGYVPLVMLPSMFKEATTFEVVFGDEKQHKLKKKAKDRVLIMLSYIYRVALQNIVASYGKHGALFKQAGTHLQPKIFQMLEQQLTKYSTFTSSDNIPDALFLRYNLVVFAELVIQEVNHSELGHDARHTLTERVYGLTFNWLIECCGESPTSKDQVDAEEATLAQFVSTLPEAEKEAVRSNVLTNRIIAFRGLKALFVNKINDREEEILWTLINNAFKSPHRQIRAAAREALRNVAIVNPDRKDKIMNFLVDKSYAKDILISQGFFLSFSSLFSEVEITIPLQVSLHLAIFKLGDISEESRNSAVSLVNQICRKYFQSGYYPLEINTKSYDTYNKSQSVLSAQFARDYPDLTLDIFHEAMRRIQLIDDLSIDRLLSYLSPWLRNVSLGSLDDKEIISLLEHLCVVTLKYGETFLDTLSNVWLAFASNETNPISILDFLMLTSVESRNHHFIVLANKIAIIIMREHPKQVVDYLVNELENISINGTMPSNVPTEQGELPKIQSWALSELLPSQPEAYPLSRSNVALKFLVDALLQRRKNEFRDYFHILLHAAVIGVDNRNPYVSEHAKLLLANILYCLVCQTPDNEQVTAYINHLSGPAKRGIALWKQEAVAIDQLNIESTGLLTELVTHMVSFLSAETTLRENWSLNALKWAARKSNVHHITRSLQIYRALNYPLTQQHLAYLVAIFFSYNYEKNPSDCGVVLEVLYTLQSIIENQDISAIESYAQIFWTIVAALYSEVHVVYITALKLIGTLIDKLDLANSNLLACGITPTKGLQPLVLKGLTAELTEGASIALLRKMTPLLPQTDVFDQNPTTRLLDNIVGLLPWLIEHFKTEDGQAAASALGTTCAAMGVPNLGAAFTSFAEDKYTTIEEFLIQFSPAFRAAYSPTYDLRVLGLFVEMFSKVPSRNPKIIFNLFFHLLSRADLSQGDIKNKALIVFQIISNNLRGPLWKEALQIIYSVSENSEKVKHIEFTEMEESLVLKQSIAAHCRLSNVWNSRGAPAAVKKALLLVIDTFGGQGAEILGEVRVKADDDEDDGCSTPRTSRRGTVRKGSQPPSPLVRQASMPSSAKVKATPSAPPELQRATSNWSIAFKRSSPSPTQSKRSSTAALGDRRGTPSPSVKLEDDSPISPKAETTPRFTSPLNQSAPDHSRRIAPTPQHQAPPAPQHPAPPPPPPISPRPAPSPRTQAPPPPSDEGVPPPPPSISPRPTTSPRTGLTAPPITLVPRPPPTVVARPAPTPAPVPKGVPPPKFAPSGSTVNMPTPVISAVPSPGLKAVVSSPNLAHPKLPAPIAKGRGQPLSSPPPLQLPPGVGKK